MVVSKKAQESLSEVEEAQVALRESIEKTKKLAAQAERLVERHRKEISDEV